ncbi:MAG: cobalt-precorrin 5A hydrolase [Desulfobacterales bacterium]
MHSLKSQPLNPAFWALTPKAGIVAARLMEKWERGKLFAGPSITKIPAGAVRFDSLMESVFRNFNKFHAHIFIMAAGIVVRTIAPCLKSKLSDPAVVVVDDHGRFAISLLSGHLGGANELAGQVARCLDALPIITTATDIGHVPAVDLLAKRYNLAIENPHAIRTVHMAMLQGQKIGLHDPLNLLSDDLAQWVKDDFSPVDKSITGVFVDYKTIGLSSHILVLRPKILSVGIGCNRNTKIDEITGVLNDVFNKSGFSIKAIKNIATIEAKLDEQGIIGLAEFLKVPVRFFSRDQLAEVRSVPTPSEMVKKHMGVVSVCEASAILASDQGKLAVPKQVAKNVTMAVAVNRSMLSA